MASPYIEADHVDPNQAQPEVPANAATDKLDRKINQRVAKAITGSTSFTSDEVQENHLVELTGTPGAPFNVDMPSGITQIVLEVLNSTDDTATIRNSAGGGAGQPVIPNGEVQRFRYDGTDFIGLGSGGGGGTVAVEDEGTPVVADANTLNFTGGGVTVSDAGSGQADIDIPIVSTGSRVGLLQFSGALVKLDSDFTISAGGGEGIPWGSAVYDTGYTEQTGGDTIPFWLGPDLTFDAAADVDPGTDNITITGHGLFTGMGPYTLEDNGNTAPTGLTDGTNYWLIRVDDNTVQLASSRANALAGTQEDITADGTGTINLNGSSRLMVPEGVSKVRVYANAAMDVDFAGASRFTRVLLNGSNLDVGGTVGEDTEGTGFFNRHAPTAVIEVSEGDYFEVTVTGSFGVTQPIEQDRTWMGIDVVEVAESKAILHVSHEETATTDGGGATSGSWETRTLNTVDKNAVPGSSLSSNVLTLPAGVYRVGGWATAYKVDSFKARLRQTSATAATLIVGTAARSAAADDVMGLSMLAGEFTLTEEETLELQMQVGTTRATDGWGLAAGFSEPERYADLVFEKIG